MLHGRVSMFAFIHGGKIFLQERGSYSKKGEEWSFFGGHLHTGEEFLEGCKREVKEELSIDIDSNDIIYIGNFSNFIEGVSDYISYVYISLEYEKYKSDICILEGDSGKFFSFEEAQKLKMFSHDYMVVDNIKRFLENEKN